MSQNRPPPAFQEYAATMMAKTEYRELNLMQRGLLMTLRLECWVNRRLPAKPETLARILGLGIDEIGHALPAIMPFFAQEAGQLICPELEDYRAYLQAIRDKKAEGGKRGAAMTNGKRKNAETIATHGSGDASGIPRVSRGSLGKLSSVQTSQTQPTESGVSADAWLNDYEKASNGR